MRNRFPLPTALCAMSMLVTGLRATAPIGFGLAVGQRWQIRLLPPVESRQMGQHLGVPLGCGTIIRTEIVIDPAHSDRIGISLQFDVPQLVPA